MPRTPLLAALLLIPVFPTAFAADIDAASRIDAVTLYADRAEITRIVEFDATAGAHRLVVGGLPDGILPQSLQLTPGTASAALRLGQVSLSTRPLPGPADAAVQELLAEIAELERKQTREHDAIAAQEAKLSFIKALAHGLDDDQAQAIRRGTIDTAKLVELADLVRDQSHTALGEITLSRFRIEEHGERIELLRREVEQLDSGDRSERIAAIDLLAEAPLAGRLELTYQVGGGAWRPLIEARLASADGALTLTQLAMVSQRTGEDWQDVTLEMSTTQPISGGLPEPEPWVIDVMPYPAPLARSPEMAPQAAQLKARNFAQGMADVAEEAMARPTAAIETAGLDTVFVAPGRVSVPSGGSEHQVLIGDWPQQATISRKAMPRVQPRAFLIADFEFAAPAPVPAAEVRLFRDGGFVGTIWQEMLVPGAKTELQFGTDDRIEVSYRLDRDGRSSEGIITDYRRTTRNYETVVTNRHANAVEVVIIDQHPVPRDERIEVELTDRTTRPSRQDVDGRAGVVAWDLELPAGASETIRFGYSVVHPADLEITHY